MKHDHTGDDLTKLYHGTQHLVHIMQEGLVPRTGLSDEEMLGKGVTTEAIYLTPDPQDAMKYGGNVIQVDARELELMAVNGENCWHYFTQDSIPVERLTFLDARGLFSALDEYNEHWKTI